MFGKDAFADKYLILTVYTLKYQSQKSKFLQSVLPAVVIVRYFETIDCWWHAVHFGEELFGSTIIVDSVSEVT